MIPLKYNTASQEVPLGYFVDSTDGNTEETGLTIANTDIKLWKSGATTLANKNSGGGTHISNGIYYAVLDATDTNTYGPMKIFVHVSGALPVILECLVMEANAYDAQYAALGTGYVEANTVQVSGDATAADNLEAMYDGTGYAGGTIKQGVDAVAISGDATAADNAESFFDGTGYAGTNNTIPTVTSVTNQVTADVTAVSGDTTAADNLELDYDGTGYAKANSTIGTTTTNTDMVSEPPTAAAIADQVWDEAKAGHVGAGSFGEEVQAHALTTDVDAVPTAVENRTEMDSNSTQLAAIVADTNELQTDDVPGLIAALNDPTAATIADAVWDELATGHTDAGKAGQQLWTDVDAILADTNELQSDDIPGTIAALNDISTAEVNTQVDTALSDIKLDHLVAVADADDPVNDSIIAKLAASDGDWSGFDNTADSLEAIRDRGDAAWITGGGGGITDILNVTPLIPESIDLANTATWRLGIMLINSLDDLPSTAEITPGTIDIDRKAIGGTSWSNIVSGAACSEAAGLIYYDEVFDTGTGYAEGDSIRVIFKSQKITVAANDYEISDATGRIFYTEMRQTERGTDSAYTGTPPTAVENRTEMDSNSTQLAAIVADTNELQTDDVPGLIAALNDPTAATIADAVWDELATGHTDAGKAGQQLWTDVDAILADTNELQSDDVPTLIAALPTAAENRTEMDSNSTQLAAIVADTNELQTDDVPSLIAALNDPTAATVADAVLDEALSGHVGAGSLGKAVADIETDATAILADTNELQSDDVPGLIAALNDLSAAQVNTEMDTAFTTIIADSVPADGTIPTREQALYMINQFLYERAVAGTTVTVKKVDGSTALMTLTLDDGTTPTSITRAT